MFERIMEKQTKHITNSLCPRCEARGNKACAAAAAEASRLYGRVAEEEYEKMQEGRSRKSWSYGLREEYIIGIGTDGRLVIEYTAKCNDCDFEHSFQLHERLAIIDPGD